MSDGPKQFRTEMVVRDNGNGVMLMNDLHIPYQCNVMLDRARRIATRLGVDTLCIGGDLANFDAVSSHPRKLTREVGLEQEIRALRKFLARTSDEFENTYVCFGNHDWRFLNRIDGSLTGETFGQLLTDRPNVTFTDQTFMDIYSDGQRYRYTHPKSYSRTPPNVERKLAGKFGCHVVGTHGHLFGQGFDLTGKYTVTALGCMCDQKKIPYVNVIDSDHPKWNKAFGVIRDGYITPFVDGITNWDNPPL